MKENLTSKNSKNASELKSTGEDLNLNCLSLNTKWLEAIFLI